MTRQAVTRLGGGSPARLDALSMGGRQELLGAGRSPDGVDRELSSIYIVIIFKQMLKY
jgi:hypothetical protein